MPGADDQNRGLPPHSDLRQLSEEELVAAIERSEEARRAGRERTGRLLAELYRRGRLSWPLISRRTGIAQTTAYELAQPYIMRDDDAESPS